MPTALINSLSDLNTHQSHHHLSFYASASAQGSLPTFSLPFAFSCHVDYAQPFRTRLQQNRHLAHRN